MRTLSAGRLAPRTSGLLFSRGHARKFLFTALAAILLAQTSLAAGVAGSARLIRERRGHTATAIGGGKVLVAGGQNLSGALADVEIFDAASGTFTVAARLLTPRAEHTATRLADGRVFLVGGRGTEALTSTEFFDPARNVFSSGPSLNSPRFGHTATLLPDGRVVVIGGNAAGTAEVFDPRAGTFTALPCHLSEPRSFHAAVRLLDGSILIAGGLSVDGKTLRSAEVLHPDTLECEPIGNMFAARARFTLRMLPDGKVQAIGGDTERTMELFNPLGYFSSLGHLAGTASSESAALRNPGRVAIIGPNARPISEIGTTGAGDRASIRPVQSLLDRVDYSLAEVPEAGFAIATGGVSSAGRYQQTAVLFDASPATVTTDQTDYAPGQTVTITGTGWLPGETVTLNLHRDTNDPPDTVLTAVADALGSITNSEYVVQTHDIDVTFLLTATGQTSGYTAQTTFTDANPNQVTVTVGQSPNPVPAGSSATYTIQVTFNGNNTTSCTVTLSAAPQPPPAWPVAPPATFSFSPPTLTSLGAPQTSVLTVTTPAGMAANTYQFRVTATPNTGSCQNAGTATSNNIPLVVVAGNSAPVINRANATVTVNEGQTANNNGTWSDANAGDTVTLTASVGTVNKAGTNASGTWTWSFATTDGPDESQTVTITANDGNGGITSTTFSLVVDNVAPTVAFTSPPATANEGETKHYVYTVTDPGVDTFTLTAGFPNCGAGNTLSNSLTTVGGGSFDCKFNDGPATPNVTVQVTDSDGAASNTASQAVTVSNVAPTVSFTTAPATANEGDTKSYVYTVTDPGVDTFTLTAGFPTCGAGNTLSNSVTNAGGGSFDCKFNDGPATPSVQVQVTDSDGAPSNTASQTVTVLNVSPTATFNAPASVNEGSAISLSLTSPLDPSPTDTTAGFQYAFDCGDGGGYGAYSATSTASCPTTDSGSRSVKGKIKDKDNGETEYTATVTVNNVAPTASLANNGPVNEGSPATVSFSSQFDPSSADTAAGFHYAYACNGGSLAGATYAGSGTSASTACTFADNGTFLVRARIIDKDNGFTEYTTSVVVNNVAPTLTAPSNQTGAEGTDASYSLGSFTDPGTADAPWTVDVNWGDTHSDSFTTGVQGAIAHNHTYSDSGTYTVTVKVTDKDTAASNTITFQVTVSNAPPTATLANNGPVNEGSPATITFSNQADSSADDVAAGFHYAYSCTNGDLSGATYANTAGSTASSTCTFDDGPSTHTVKARIIDKDDGFTDYTTVVTVNNVNPTASLGNNGPVNEGSPATISFSAQFDPSNADTTAGFHYAYACDNGDLSGSTYALAGTSPTFPCTFVDNGTYTVKARIIDKDGGFTEYTTSVTVNNVVPTVTAPAGQSSNEGENKNFSLGSFSDPGTADNPWTVNVNWGDGHSDSFAVGAQGAISHSHIYDDNGTYTVTYTVTDKDGGVSTPASTFSVTVANVAPTATLANDGPINEGGTVNVTFSNQLDPSNADTTAGFHYAYSCTNGDLSGATYAGSSLSATTTCSFNDNGSFTVKARIIDKDGGFTEYTTSVTVNNVAPTASLANNGPVNEGSPATISFSAQFDPSSADTAAGFHYAYACNGGSLAGATYAGSGTSASTACTFADNGTYLVRARIIDKDDGFTEYTTSVTVNNVAPTLTSPGDQTGNEGVDKSYGLGSFTDPGTLDSPWTVDVNWGDSNSDSFTTGTQGEIAHNHTYLDSGTYTVTVKVTDKDTAASNTITFQVTVANAPPTADLANNGPVNEGSPATITFSNQADTSPADTAAGFHYAYSCTNGDLSGATYAGSGTNASTTCTFDDGPSTHTVKARIIDKDDGFTEYTTVVTVNNVNPTASLGNNGPVNEGSPATISFTGQFDPSNADTTAGFHYTFACDNGDLSGSTYALGSPSPSTTCGFVDNGTYTVRARIIDKDGGFTEYTTVVTVNNVVPSVTPPAGQTSDEGENKVFSLGSFSDPGTADSPWFVSVNWGDGHSDSFSTNFSGAISHSHTYDDNGTYTVTYTVTDKDGGVSTPASTFSVTVNNVAPTATFSAPASVDEGGAISLSLTAPFDPSNADTTAGFQYAFDCGDGSGYGAFSATSTASCPTTDSGSRTVKATIKDKDNGHTEYTTTVTVNNVAPTAVLSNSGPVNEGSPATISFSAQFDPSSADTAAGFHYAYSCSNGDLSGATYAGSGASPSSSCTFADNGTYIVKARIIDKDNGFTEYTTSIVVNNVAPTLTSPGNQTGNEGVDKSYDLGSFTDPGTLDAPWKVDVNWGDSNSDSFTTGVQGATAHNHTYADSGTYTVTVTVTDKDNAPSNTITFQVTVVNTPPTADIANNGPVNEGSPATITFSNQFDPSAADTAAGFHYAYSCSNGDLSAATYASSGTNATTTCTFDDGPSTHTVKARIIDKDDGFTEYTTDVVVNNVNPTASLGNNGPVNEGSPVTISFSGQFDPSNADTTAGFHYAYACDNSDLSGSTYALAGTSPTSTCTFIDNGTYTVKARIIDKDGGFTEYTTSVTVNNVVPTVTAPAGQSSDEGENKLFSLGSFSDPGTADNPWTVNVNWGDGHSDSFAVGSQGAISHSHTYDDNGTYTVTYTVTDKDSGVSTPASTFSVTVNNVAPTATLANNGPIDEGGSVNVTFTGASDPSNADTTAGFHYAFSCTNGDLSGATYAGSGTSASTSCTFSDNGTKTVKARIIDKDGGFTEYTTDVTVNNVAPTASLGNNGPVNEGSPATISFSAPFDPSSDDTAAGFHYAFDCNGGSLAGATYAGSSAIPSTTCTFGDNGSRTVSGRIIDKDGGFTDYTTTVTVNNVVPSVTPPGNQASNEGEDKSFSLGSFSDPGTSDNPWTVNVNWGDGHSESFAVNSQGAIAHNHTYDDNGTYTVSYTVTDKDGGVSTPASTFSITVSNVAPTGTLSNNGPVNEGAPATVSFSGQSDPSNADTTAGFHYAFACDNGDLSGATYAGCGTASSTTCTFGDNGPHTVKARIIDKDGGFTEYTTVVQVNNANPSVGTVTVSPEPSNEGSSASASASFTDAGSGDTHTCSINWGDGNTTPGTVTESSGNGSCSGSHTYADNGSYTVTITVIDDDGGAGSSFTTHVVNNVNPVVATPTLSASAISENGSTNLSGTFTDPGTLDTHTVTINWGDGSINTVINLPAGTLSYGPVPHTYLDDNPTGTPSDNYTIGVTVTDKDGGSDYKIAMVGVANVAPIITSTSGTSTPQPIGSTASVTANFTDVGSQDTHTCTFAWDDGSPNTTVTAAGMGNGSCTATHSYTTAGVNTVTVTVKDDDTGQASATYQFIVIYDPNGGFVTGGGWINQPADGFPAIPGKANFGFVSKYQTGKNATNVPTGETEFQFQSGDINFHSSAYDAGSLVISGGKKATYRGDGTVNGQTGYRFLLIAYDGDAPGAGGPDRFRIKITKNGTVIYDNRPGSSEDPDLSDTTVLGGGSIVIHK